MTFHKILRIAEHAPRADKSGLAMHVTKTSLSPGQPPRLSFATFGYASLWLMQRGDGHDKSAPTDGPGQTVMLVHRLQVRFGHRVFYRPSLSGSGTSSGEQA